MSVFDEETSVDPLSDDTWMCRLTESWSTDGTPNGGYALSPVLRVLGQLAGHPDPLTVTAHFLRPALADEDGMVRGAVLRSGRTMGTATATLNQDGRDRIAAIATFGTLSGTGEAGPEPRPPVLPDPSACVPAAALEDGVAVTIGSRVEVLLDPSCSTPGGSDRARIAGWVRLSDGSDPDVWALPMVCDALPPSLYALRGRFGWVPTVEMTVQVRGRPAPGWLQVDFQCDDVRNGSMIESGTVWDSDGRVVARSRQLGLVRRADDPAAN